MTRDEARQYVERWKQLGPLLEEQEKKELRNYSEAQWKYDVAALLDLAAQFAVPRKDSGFLEQQRLFQLAAK